MLQEKGETMSKRRFRFAVKVKDEDGKTLRHDKICDAQKLIDAGKAEVLSLDGYGRIRSVQLSTSKPMCGINKSNSSISYRESAMNASCVGRHVDTLGPLEAAASEKVQSWLTIYDAKAPLLIARIGGHACGPECEH